jgi:TRAP-type C4-dicarboxylate transport system permease small subunit
MAAVTTYTGVLMHRTYLRQPQTRSYVDLLYALLGPHARTYGLITVYALVFLVMCGAIVASVESWSQLVLHTCKVTWAFVATFVILILGQAQSMHKLSMLSLIAFIMILLPVIIIFIELRRMTDDPNGDTPQGSHVVTGSNFKDMIVSMSDIFFAFAGSCVYEPLA